MSKDVMTKSPDSAMNEKKKKRTSYRELFQQGIFAGIGWAIGVTIGFVMISIVLVFVLRNLGGMPIVGSWIASVVESTQEQLARRTPLIIPQ